MALVGDGALRGLDPYSAHVLDLRRGLLRDLHPYWPLPWRPTATRHDSSPGGRTRAWAQADAGAGAGGGSGGRRRRRPPHSFPGCARRDRPRRSAADPSDTALQPDSPTAPDSNERRERALPALLCHDASPHCGHESFSAPGVQYPLPPYQSPPPGTGAFDSPPHA